MKDIDMAELDKEEDLFFVPSKADKESEKRQFNRLMNILD
jgi:hypothetical protein